MACSDGRVMGGKRKPSGARIDLEIAIELSPGRWVAGIYGRTVIVDQESSAAWLQHKTSAEWVLTLARRFEPYPDAKFHWRVK